MTFEEVNPTAIAVFLTFVVLSLSITWWAAKRTRSASEFYSAGSSITGFQNGLALAGDFMSAATFLGLTGLVFIGGADGMLFTSAIVVSWAFILFVLADRMRNLGRYTFADIVAYRLDQSKLRVLAAAGALTVAIPYLIAQMVGAGALIETLFGIPYLAAVTIVGTLMMVYVVFGGMLATTWVQVTKAILLLGGGTALLILVLGKFGFDFNALFDRAAETHPRGPAILLPGGLYQDPISVISLALAFICGTAGLPHVLMRFFTVPDARQARRSIGYAVAFIGYFQAAIVLVGFGAITLLIADAGYVDESGRISGGANMVAIHLSRLAGGEVFYGFIAAVAFATILAVVAGILLSASAAVSHDVYNQVIRRGKLTSEQEMRVSRIATVVIGGIAIALSVLFREINVGVLSTIALAVAASVNFPAIILSLYWSGLTTRGAIAGGVAGLVTVVVLIVLGPTVWVNVLGNEEAVFPYAYPTLFSVGAAFLVTVSVSVTDRSAAGQRERDAYPAQLERSETGV